MDQEMSYQSPDVVDKPDDEKMSTSEQSPSDEKRSMFGKLREKTKHKTSKLKHKLKPGAGGGDAPADGLSRSSNSDDESSDSSNNAFSGMTQPEYERKLNAGQLSPLTDESSRTASSNVTTPAPTIAEFNKKTTDDFEPSHGQVTEHSDLSKQFQGLSTDEKSSSLKDAPNSGVLNDDQFGEKNESQTVQKDDILSKVGDPKADDSDVAKDRPDPEGLLSGKKSAEAPKSWGKWVGEKVGLSKPSTSPTTTATPTSPSAASDKPMTDKVKETLAGAKDTVMGEASHATDSTKSFVEQNKEAAATTDPQKQTYTQKFTGAIYGAKESILSSTHPGDEDKALSQKVTDTVSNLPTTIKSTLGFGNKSTTGAAPTSPTANTTTTTPRSLDTPPTPTEESSSALPQSPSIVSRITGSVSSLFGKKQPSDSTPTSAEGVAASESMKTDA